MNAPENIGATSTTATAVAAVRTPTMATAPAAQIGTVPERSLCQQQQGQTVMPPLPTSTVQTHASPPASAAPALSSAAAAATALSVVPNARVDAIKGSPKGKQNVAREQPQQQTEIIPLPQPKTADAAIPPTAAVPAASTNVADPNAAKAEATSTPQPDFRARMAERKAAKAREALEAQAREAREAERLKVAEEAAARQAVRDEEKRKREEAASREQELLNERIRAREEAAERVRAEEARRKQQEEDDAKTKRLALEAKAAANLDVYTARVLEARKAKAAEASAAAQPVGTSTPGPRGAPAAPTEEVDSVPLSEGEMSVGGLSAGGGDESFAEYVSDGSYVSSYGGSFDGGGGGGGEVMW